MMNSRSSRFFTCISLLVAILAVGALPVTGGDNGQLVIRQMFGTVEVQRAGATGWKAANERMQLRLGDRVRTAANSWATLEFSPGNIVRLMAESRLRVIDATERIEQVAERGIFGSRQAGSYMVALEVGQAFPNMDRLEGRSMMLSTPVAVAGVRGTSFLATVEESTSGGASYGGTYNVDIAVYSGTVAVMDMRNTSAGLTNVPAGYAISFHNVHVPSGGFQAAQSLGAGQRGGRAGGQEPGQGRGPGMGQQQAAGQMMQQMMQQEGGRQAAAGGQAGQMGQVGPAAQAGQAGQVGQVGNAGQIAGGVTARPTGALASQVQMIGQQGTMGAKPGRPGVQGNMPQGGPMRPPNMMPPRMMMHQQGTNPPPPPPPPPPINPE